MLGLTAKIIPLGFYIDFIEVLRNVGDYPETKSCSVNLFVTKSYKLPLERKLL